jgi:hypothetical protein
MKFIINLLLLVIALKTAAQPNIICPKLTDSTLNYFYIGVDNPIEIIGNKKTDNYTLAISGGGAVITKISANHYMVKVNTQTDDCRIVIMGNNGKIILKKDFKVRVIYEPVAILSGIMDLNVSRNRILLNPFLTVMIRNCYFKIPYQIISFTAIFINGSDSIPTIANGNILSQEQTGLVRNAEIGSKIYFDNIRANEPDGRARKISPFWMKIQ